MPKKADSVSAKRTRNLSFTCLTSRKCCHRADKGGEKHFDQQTLWSSFCKLLVMSLTGATGDRLRSGKKASGQKQSSAAQHFQLSLGDKPT